MNTPTATYRVQFNKNFTFKDLKDILPYLSQLGVSHIYASPIFQARSGSMHGYDVTDPTKVSEELGGRAGFEEAAKAASALGLGWIQDIVPNHASYSVENPRLADVMSKGAGSPYACYFDVDWNYPSEKIMGKLFLPILMQPYRRCLQGGQISLVHDGGFRIRYGSLKLPVNAATQQHLELDGSAEQTLEKYNSNPQLLDSLLIRQYYRLGYWKTALKHINYRRFFDITDLIGVRMESPQAFEDIHSLIFELVDIDSFSGLRIDHIDGLFDPQDYLRQLRERCPDRYIVVEKILTGEERLPDMWPVDGTTGYEFTNYVTKLFVKDSSEPEINAAYRELTGSTEAFSERLYEAKKTIIESSFMGDAVNLARLFYRTLRKLGYAAPLGRQEFVRAFVELLASFPVYRTYVDEPQQDTAVFKAALRLAEQRNPQYVAEFRAIDYLRTEAENSPEAMYAFMRFQQFTGAVMAKGFEDTAFYRYPRLLSLNDVGSSPDQFGVSTTAFHEFNRLRQQKWPLSMNATSTHDSKRGEDVRARLNVLSELPQEFRAHLGNWRQINSGKKRQIGGVAAPDGTEEYYLYQTLIGAYPFGSSGDFAERIKLHIVKALREAKVHTSWLASNLQYENAVTNFTGEILSSKSFLDTFLPFQQKVAYPGCINSLAQTLLKIACPGVPDFYQGSELWDLNLVDPDNRRPVDFQFRQTLLAETLKVQPDKASELLQTLETGQAKLYLIRKALQFRRKHRRLFERGEYLPLAVEGPFAEHVFAFCRRRDASYTMAVVPRFPASLLNIRGGGSSESNRSQSYVALNKGGGGASEMGSRQEPFWRMSWQQTYVRLPMDTPAKWIDVFTGRAISALFGWLTIDEVLSDFPVALLVGGVDG